MSLPTASHSVRSRRAAHRAHRLRRRRRRRRIDPIPPLQRNDPVRDWTFSRYSRSASTGSPAASSPHGRERHPGRRPDGKARRLRGDRGEAQFGYCERFQRDSRLVRPAYGPARSGSVSSAPRQAHSNHAKELVMNVTAFAKWTGTLLLLLTLTACGGSGDGDAGGGSGGGSGGGAPPVSAVIGPAGGTVIGPNGASVVIPAGAAATDTTITIETDFRVGHPSLPTGVVWRSERCSHSRRMASSSRSRSR